MDKREERAAPRAGAAPRTGETYAIAGGSDVRWGVDAASELGTVLSHDVDDTAQYERVENQQGAVTGIVIYDTETAVKLSIVAKAAAARPAVGSTLTVGGVSCTVLKSATRAANKQCQKIEIEASGWANLSLAAGG